MVGEASSIPTTEPTGERPGLPKEEVQPPTLLNFLRWLIDNPGGILVQQGKRFVKIHEVKDQVKLYRFIKQMSLQWLEEHGHIEKGKKIR